MNAPSIIAALWEAISPARLELLAKQFGVDPVWIGHCAAADPTDGKYVSWILKLWKAGKLRFPEDTEKVHTRLSQFTKLSRTSTWTGPKDLNRFASYADLVREIEAAAPGKKQAARTARDEGAELLAEKDDRLLYKVTTPEAAANLFRGTEWCVKDPKFFNEYNPRLFYHLAVLGEGGEEPFKLLHLGKHQVQCMDVFDDPTDIADFVAMGMDVKAMLLADGNPIALANFTIEHLGERWPEAESTIATHGPASIVYTPVLKSRFLEAEPVLLQSGTNVAYYVDVLRNSKIDPPWPDWRWPEGEEKLLADAAKEKVTIPELDRLARWAATKVGGSWPEAEALLLHHAWASPSAAKYVEWTNRGAWPEFETVLFAELDRLHSTGGLNTRKDTIDGAIAYGTTVYPKQWSPYAERLLAALTQCLQWEIDGYHDGVTHGIGPLVRLFRDVIGWQFEAARAEAEKIEAQLT